MGDVKRFPAITPEQPVCMKIGPNEDEQAVIEAARKWEWARLLYIPGEDRWNLDRAEEELARAVRRLD